MKTIARRISPCCLVVFVALGVAHHAVAQDAAARPLQWRLEPGAVFVYRTTVDTTKVRGDGAPKRVAHEVDSRWTIDSVDGGRATATVEVLRATYRDRRNRFDSESTKSTKETGRFGRMVKTIRSLMKRKMKLHVDGNGVATAVDSADAPRFFIQQDAIELGLILPSNGTDAAWSQKRGVLQRDSATDAFSFERRAGAGARARVDYVVKRTDTDTAEDLIDGRFESLDGNGLALFDVGAGRLSWLREVRTEKRVNTKRRNRVTTIRTVKVVRLLSSKVPDARHTIEFESFDGTTMCALDGKSLGRLPRALKKLRDRLSADGAHAAILLRVTPDIRPKILGRIVDLCGTLGRLDALELRALEPEG